MGIFISRVPTAVTPADSGTTPFDFTVTRSGDLSAGAQVDYYLWTDGSANGADSSDFSGPTAGTVSFAPNQSTATIEIAVNPDTPGEPNETFHVSLANARGDTITSSGASATIGGLIEQPLADGGRVEVRLTADGEVAQKFDAAGAAVGSPITTAGNAVSQIVPTANGGYVLVAAGAIGDETVKLVDASNHVLASNPGYHSHIAAAPDGTVLVATEVMPHHASSSPTLTLYDASGAVVASAQYAVNDVPSVALDGDGHYVVSRGDFHLVVDPANAAAALQAPGAISGPIVGIDDSGPIIRNFGAGDYTDDGSPSFHVPVTATGAVEVLSYSGGVSADIVDTPVTAADVARGYVDVSLGSFYENYDLTFRLVSDGGLVGPTTSLPYTVVDHFPLAYAYMVDGDRTSSNNGNSLSPDVAVTTDKSDPGVVLRVSAEQIGDTLQLFDNGTAVGSALLVNSQPDQFGLIYIPTTAHLQAGSNQLWVETRTPDGQVLEGAAATVTVNSSSGPPTLALSAPAPTAEGDSGSTDFAFTVTRTGDLSAASAVDYYLAYGGTADSSDFAGPTAGTANFAAGQSTAVIHVAVAGDTAVEPDETFTIALANSRGAVIDADHGSATATILNDDGPSGGGGGGSAVLSIAAPAAAHEGTSGTTDFAFTVTRDGDASGAALVDYYLAYGGTADSADFAGPTAGTVSFAAGETTATIHVAVAGDTLPEGDETFIITLANGRGAAIDGDHGSATATILDGAAGGSASGSVSTSEADYTAPAGVRDITLTGSSSQTVHGNDEGDTFLSNNNGNTLVGGTGDDTFILGRNGDVATGGGGHDTFVFQENPWSPSGLITDFGADDVIDLTGTLNKAGYFGADPVAAGFVKFTEDSSGDAQVWFNPDPGHTAAFWLVTSLDGVSASSLHANAGLITV